MALRLTSSECGLLVKAMRQLTQSVKVVVSVSAGGGRSRAGRAAQRRRQGELGLGSSRQHALLGRRDTHPAPCPAWVHARVAASAARLPVPPAGARRPGTRPPTRDVVEVLPHNLLHRVERQAHNLRALVRGGGGEHLRRREWVGGRPSEVCWRAPDVRCGSGGVQATAQPPAACPPGHPKGRMPQHTAPPHPPSP